MPGRFEGFRVKARESLRAAEAEFAANRFDPAIALAYYACYQVGIAAIVHEDRSPPRRHHLAWPTVDRWLMLEQRPDLVGIIGQMYGMRREAQYERRRHSRADARVTIERAREVLDCLSQRLDRLHDTPTKGGQT